MESILVLTHADESGSVLTRASLEAVTAGKGLAARLSATLTIGIVAANAISAAIAIASADARIFAISGEAFAQELPRSVGHDHDVRGTHAQSLRVPLLPAARALTV